MILLMLREIRKLVKNPVPWILLIIMTLSTILAWQSLSTAESLKRKEEMDPIARYRMMLTESPDLKQQEEALITIEEALEDPDLTEEERLILEEQMRSQMSLSTGGFLQEWYQEGYFVVSEPEAFLTLTTEPEYADEFEKVQALMATARDDNLKNRVYPYLDHGLDFSAYSLRLFTFSQSGFHIISALILGVMSARIQENPLSRKIGSWRILLSRIGALTLIGILVLILPRITASVIMGYRNGWGNIDLIVPFNPRAGHPLFLKLLDPAMLIHTLSTSIGADSLIRLGPAFVLMYVYEVAQLFLWLSIGLLFGSLTRRKFLSIGIPLAIILLLGGITAPFIESQATGLLFPLYQDAVRDVIGGGNMLTGHMIHEDPPLDFSTGIAVMTLSGLAALNLTDLKQKRLHPRQRKGEADEAL